MEEEGFSPCVFADKVGDAVPRAGEVDLGVRENGSSPDWPNIILPFPPKVNLFTSFPCDAPDPCVTAAKLKPEDPDEKEKPLLLLCSSAEEAAETSVFDGWPNTKPDCGVVVLSEDIFWIPCVGFRLAWLAETAAKA